MSRGIRGLRADLIIVDDVVRHDRFWWEGVSASFVAMLPPVPATIFRLGGKDYMSLVRVAERRFSVFYEGSPVADITSLLKPLRWVGGPGEWVVPIERVLERACWLADHAGLCYAPWKSRRRGARKRNRRR
jgi:hypothetical protein